MEQLVKGQVVINSDDYQGDHNGNREIDIGSDTSETEDSSDNNSETDNKETSTNATKDFTTINARPCRMRTLRAATFCNDEATVRATGRRLGPSSLKQADKKSEWKESIVWVYYPQPMNITHNSTFLSPKIILNAEQTGGSLAVIKIILRLKRLRV